MKLFERIIDMKFDIMMHWSMEDEEWWASIIGLLNMS